MNVLGYVKLIIETTITTEHSLKLLLKSSPPMVKPSLGLKPSPVESQDLSLGWEPSLFKPQPRADTAVEKDGMLIVFMFIELCIAISYSVVYLQVYAYLKKVQYAT